MCFHKQVLFGTQVQFFLSIVTPFTVYLPHAAILPPEFLFFLNEI